MAMGPEGVLGRKNSGFTVTEMVAVMALIFILAWFLIPALMTARETGRSAKCMANLKQLIQAVNVYVQEDRLGRFPGWDLCWDHTCWDQYWQLMPLLMPYLNGTSTSESSYALFVCPSNKKTLTPLQKDAQGHEIMYEYNGKINGEAAQTIVNNPEWVMVLCDWPVNPAAPDQPIHRGGSNVAFFDGHVKWFSRNDMMNSHHAPKTSGKIYYQWGQN